MIQGMETSVPLYGAGPGLTSGGNPRSLRRSYTNRSPDAKLITVEIAEGSILSEHKPEDTFRVIDRRPFTAEGELRHDVVEQEEREAAKAARAEALKPQSADASPAAPAQKETPKRSTAFENLVRMIGSNAAMVLGAYADPQTGQPIVDPDAARELIDMLDALHEKTLGNLAPEEDSLLSDLLGKLKMTYLEISQEAAPPVQARAKTRG